MCHLNAPPYEYVNFIVLRRNTIVYKIDKGGVITTKAVKGEARIFKRSDGYYGCTWTAKLPDGTSKRIVLSAKTEEAIIAKRDAKKQELARGEYVARNGITFEQWSSQWIDEYKQMSLGKNTYNQYKSTLRIHINPRLGAKALQKVTTSDIQRCINLIAKKYPTTARDASCILSQCFTQAVINRLIGFNPVMGIKLPKKETVRERKAFTKNELKKLVNAAKAKENFYVNPTLYPALRLMIETGCRRGEILGLKWKNVDAQNSTIKIKDTVIQVEGRIFEKDTPKNKSSVRILPVSQETMALLLSIKGESQYVFHTKEGKPISPRNFNRRFSQWCKKAGLWEDGKATHVPHELRHTFITDMLDAKESIPTVQALTGHSTPRVLLTNYAHKVPQSVASAMKRRKSRLQKIIQ